MLISLTSSAGQGGLMMVELLNGWFFTRLSLIIKFFYLHMGSNHELNEKLIELELAKSDNANTKVKKFLPAAVIMVSLYYSYLFAIGLAIGYIGSKIFSKYLLESGKVESIFIDCGKWKIHLHHWIMGAAFLLIVWFIDYFYLPSFFVGVVFGIIAHDIYDFNDWHKVVVKNEIN